MSSVDPDADLSQFYDFPKSAEGVEKTFVLDGQQRLQTLHAIFRGGFREDSTGLSEAYCNLTSRDEGIESGELGYPLIFSSETLPLPMFRVRDLAEGYANGNPMTIGRQTQ